VTVAAITNVADQGRRGRMVIDQDIAHGHHQRGTGLKSYTNSILDGKSVENRDQPEQDQVEGFHHVARVADEDVDRARAQSQPDTKIMYSDQTTGSHSQNRVGGRRKNSAIATSRQNWIPRCTQLERTEATGTTSRGTITRFTRPAFSTIDVVRSAPLRQRSYKGSVRTR